jgi:hypothetical protein
MVEVTVPRRLQRRFGLPVRVKIRRQRAGFRYERDEAGLMPAGLHLNRFLDRPARPWRPARRGRLIFGCWLKIGDRYVVWNWPVSFEVER